MYSDLERTISGGKPSQIRRILETPASEEDTNHDETCNQEPQIAPVRNSEVKDIPPVPWSTSSEFVEEFTFIPAEDPKLVRILCHDYEFKKESVMQENQKWRCTTDSCAANLMFIESASAFTDVHLLHNHPPPDLSSLNIENALKVKLCPPVASVVKNEDHRIQDGGILDDSPLPLDPSWVWDGPEPLREAVSEGYPPLPPTDQHCPICFMNRSKFDVWKCQACTSTMKSWRNKLRYTVPPILPDCYHSLFQPKFNCNGCRRRRLQWEWTHRQTRPLGLPLIQY